MAVSQLRKHEKAFSDKRFFAPGREYGSTYSWVWDTPLDEEKIDAQLEKMALLGVKNTYIIPEPKEFRPTCQPTFLEPDYLSKEYHRLYKYALEKAFSLGMSAWLYDEGGWPSGGACGKVLLKYPHLARRILAFKEKSYEKGQVYSKPEMISASFINGKKMIQDGFKFSAKTTVTEYYSKVCFCEQVGEPDYPDLTLKETTERFIEIVHEAHKEHLKEYFGKGITAVFSDEPCADLMFRDELIKEYENRYNESLLPYLPELAKKVKITKKGAEVRVRYYGILADYFCNNYMLKEKQWSNQNGMLFTGHMDGDDSPLTNAKWSGYHVMRSLRIFDVPGVDVIWRQVFPTSVKQRIKGTTIEADNKFFPRYASSAMTQTGGHCCLAECFGAYGNGLTFEQMRYIYGFQAIRGINIYNPMFMSVKMDGLMITRGGAMNENYACSFRDLKPFNDYVERLSYLSCLGQRKTTLALYFPMFDTWAGIDVDATCKAYDKAGKELEQSLLYFDIFDDYLIEECDKAQLKKGKLVKADACYTELVVSPNRFIRKNTKKALETFISGGGKVYVVESDFSPVIEGAIYVKDCVNLLANDIGVIGEYKDLRVQERILDNGRLLLLYNEGNDPLKVMVNAKEENTYVLDINVGKVISPTKKEGVIEQTVLSGEITAVLYSDAPIVAEEVFKGEKETTLNDFTLRKSRQFLIKEMTTESVDVSEGEIKVCLGDWRKYLGEDFSGSCIYKTEFAIPKTAKDTITLDLGKVFISAEAFVNGKTLGVKVMPPYSYEIPVGQLSKNNVLEVRVSGGVANQYVHTKHFDKWQDWQKSPYEMIEKYDKDSLDGGLIGPVKITY